MKLRKYDDKLVRIETNYDEVFEGYVYYNDKEYNEHEFGRCEDSVQMLYFMFYECDIKKISIIKDFSDKYGYLEELIATDEIDLIEEALDCDDEIHKSRLISYINDHIDKLDNKDEILKLIEKYK